MSCLHIVKSIQIVQDSLFSDISYCPSYLVGRSSRKHSVNYMCIEGSNKWGCRDLHILHKSDWMDMCPRLEKKNKAKKIIGIIHISIV